jgi:predicted transcriptional regulator
MLIQLLKINNYLLVYLLIVIAVNLLLLTLPLTSVFGYEFAAINSLLLSFLSGLYIISSLKKTNTDKSEFNNKKFYKALILFLLLPFTISIINSIVVGFCSFWDGLFFYLVITLPSVIIGSAIGSAIFFTVKKFRILIFIILYLLILFVSVIEIYFNPQIYLYNPLFAYFPGTIYDEGLSVDIRLFLYRVFNLLFFLSILFYFLRWGIKSRYSRNVGFSFLAVGITIIFYFFVTPMFGWTTTESRLKEELASRVESKHFVLHADERIDSKVIEQIVLNQEFYYSQLRNYFLEEPETKINSFIFSDSKQKKDLFGSDAADVAKPWLNSIYVSLDSWESTLKHEIAHCFTASFGTGIFKLAAGFNPALIEGVAEAADGFYDENDIHHLATLAFKNEFKINLSKVFSGFSFFGSVSSLSYIYSGSFIQYLVSEFGIEKVKQYYRTNNFNESFSAELIEVAKDYESFLNSLTTNDKKDRAIYYFGRKPLIMKVCPRYVASALRDAWDFYALNEYDKAENRFQNILAKAESYSAVVGLSRIYEDKDSLQKAIELYNSYQERFSGTSSEYDLRLRLADLYVKASKLEKARELYNSLILSKPSRRLELIAHTRLALMRNDTIDKYVKGSEYDRYTILRELNSKTYFYPSIPLMIDLSNSVKENYLEFLHIFENHLEVIDEMSSYAVFKLSEYMLKNFDYVNARKMSGFALRFKGDSNLLKLTEQQFKKADWFYRNAKRILDETNFGVDEE